MSAYFPFKKGSFDLIVPVSQRKHSRGKFFTYTATEDCSVIGIYYVTNGGLPFYFTTTDTAGRMLGCLRKKYRITRSSFWIVRAVDLKPGDSFSLEANFWMRERKWAEAIPAEFNVEARIFIKRNGNK